MATRTAVAAATSVAMATFVGCGAHDAVRATPMVVGTKGLLGLSDEIRFELGGARPRRESEAVLAAVARFLDARPDVTLLRIVAYVDDVGAHDSVEALMRGRAVAVAAWLVAHGVACTRLRPVVVDLRSPVVCNTCDENPRPNRRRIELRLGEPDAGSPAEVPAGDACPHP
jgi:outer membrane protein OmpA-like peptidoglycan-associated protein